MPLKTVLSVCSSPALRRSLPTSPKNVLIKRPSASLSKTLNSCLCHLLWDRSVSWHLIQVSAQAVKWCVLMLRATCSTTRPSILILLRMNDVLQQTNCGHSLSNIRLKPSPLAMEPPAERLKSLCVGLVCPKRFRYLW